jgi:hypothetical protein
MKKMSNSGKIPPNGKLQPLFKQLVKISKLFHMNELEVVVWSLWLDNLCWTMNNHFLDEILFISAIQTKEYMNDKEAMKLYMNELTLNHRNIVSAYENWVKDKRNEINVNMKDINKRYSEYRQVCILYNLLAFY